MLYLCVRMTKQNLIVREISGITRVSEINRCDCCHWKRYFFGGILVVILTVFQQGADQEPISFAGQYPGIETEFIADYTLYGEDDENCICPSSSRNRKNLLHSVAEKYHFSTCFSPAGERKIVFTRFCPIPILRSFLCVYRI